MSDQVLKAFEEAFGVWTTTGHFKHKPTQHQLDGFRKGYSIAEQASADRIAQLEAELAEARKDQARYQWIRNESWAMYNYNKGKPHLVTFDSLQRPTHLAENAVDQAIDAAIKEQGK